MNTGHQGIRADSNLLFFRYGHQSAIIPDTQFNVPAVIVLPVKKTPDEIKFTTSHNQKFRNQIKTKGRLNRPLLYHVIYVRA
ncbi:hypothetical protein TUM12151_09910 [Morganella morganii]|nr:hypothetical protein TUM12149_13930 [Morganella morganii]GIZ31965.1 hypothetical protein TUM12150_24510 [Morganella morganii]GIZ34005.1 hypothetical protein TUM12151_09910 [Morganella morganii]